MHNKDFFSMLKVVFTLVPVFGGTHRQDFSVKEETNNSGVTLIELIVVISVIAALLVAVGFSYSNWLGSYKVEKVTKELYADLMNARGLAMMKNTEHFVDFNYPAQPAGYGAYRIAEDTNRDDEGDADADGVIDATGHKFLPSKKVEYVITNNFARKIINFNRRGLVQPRGQALGGTICLFTDKDPDYDCIVISRTRIIMGKLIKQISSGGECEAENCAKK